MTKFDQKERKLTPTKGTGGVGDTGRVYKSGSLVSVELKSKYSRYVESLVSLDELPEGLDPLIREYRVPVNLSRDSIEGIGLEVKHVANVLVLLPLIKHITDFKLSINRKKIFKDGAQINSQILRSFLLTLDNETKDFLLKLEKAGWISVNHSYQVKERSKQYKIGPKFENSEWIKVDWRENLEKFLPEILQKSNIARRKEVLYDLWNRASCYFLDWGDMPEGQIKELCRKTSEIGHRLRVNWSEELKWTVIGTAIKHYNEQINAHQKTNSVEEIISGYYSDLNKLDGKGFYTILHDQRYKFPTFRLFTPYTNLKKELRQFITLDGQKLCNIDIRSCQVALLSTLYNDSPADQEEKGNFQFRICSEDIYEYLAGENSSRKEVKIMMFKVMFDKTVNQKGQVYDKFKEKFPILAQRVAETKIGNYKKVAFLMQNRESEIMIAGALTYLLLEKGVECLSIHDSISCFEEHVPIVRETITKFFYEKMGFCPEVRRD